MKINQVLFRFSMSTGGQMGQGWRTADKIQFSMQKGMLNITE